VQKVAVQLKHDIKESRHVNRATKLAGRLARTAQQRKTRKKNARDLRKRCDAWRTQRNVCGQLDDARQELWERRAVETRCMVRRQVRRHELSCQLASSVAVPSAKGRPCHGESDPRQLAWRGGDIQQAAQL